MFYCYFTVEFNQFLAIENQFIVFFFFFSILKFYVILKGNDIKTFLFKKRCKNKKKRKQEEDFSGSRIALA